MFTLGGIYDSGKSWMASSVLNDAMQTLEIWLFLRCHHCKISFLEQENTASVQRNEVISGEVEEIKNKIRAIEVYLQ